jgi:acyl-coenzyme A thioesterase PaaI-like protein
MHVSSGVDHDHFRPWPHPSPMLDAIESFLHDPADPHRMGFTVTRAKTNGRGFLHAGVIATIADVSIGHTLAAASASTEAGPRRFVTVNLSCDLLAVANLDEWVDVTVTPTRVGRKLAAGLATFRTDRPIATVTALFIAR